MNVVANILIVMLVLMIVLFAMVMARSGLDFSFLGLILLFSLSIYMLVRIKRDQKNNQKSSAPFSTAIGGGAGWLSRARSGVKSEKEKRKITFIIAAVSYSLAIASLSTIGSPVREGKLAPLYRFMNEQLGEYGIPIWWFAIGTIFLIKAVVFKKAS